MNSKQRTTGFILLCSLTISILLNISAYGANSNLEITGELMKWHKVTLEIKGPEVSENDEFNPFFHYRLNVTFTHKSTGKAYLIPGYFAADALPTSCPYRSL